MLSLYEPSCPVCGGAAEHIHVYAGEEIVRCVNSGETPGCSMSIAFGYTETAAWTEWRRRVDDWTLRYKGVPRA